MTRFLKAFVVAAFTLIGAAACNQVHEGTAELASQSASTALVDCTDKAVKRDALKKELAKLRAAASVCAKGGAKDEAGVCRCDDEYSTREDTIRQATCAEYKQFLFDSMYPNASCGKGGAKDEAGVCRCDDEYSTREDTISQATCADYKQHLFDTMYPKNDKTGKDGKKAKTVSTYAAKRDIAAVEKELAAAEASLTECRAENKTAKAFKKACEGVSGAKHQVDDRFLDGAACICGGTQLSLNVYKTYIDRKDAKGFASQCAAGVASAKPSDTATKAGFKSACTAIKNATFKDGEGAGGALCECGPDTSLSFSVFETYVKRGDKGGFTQQCSQAAKTTVAEATLADLSADCKAAGGKYTETSKAAGGAQCACTTSTVSFDAFKVYAERGDRRGFIAECGKAAPRAEKACTCGWSTQNHCAVWKDGAYFRTYIGPIDPNGLSCGDGGVNDLCKINPVMAETLASAECQ